MNRPQYAKNYALKFIKTWPVIVQPKKDGVRCLAESELCLPPLGWCKPRDKKELVPHKHHIQAKLRTHFLGVNFPAPLDGELFTPGGWFEDIVSGVKGPESEYHEVLEYHLFDLMNPDMICAERLTLLDLWHTALPDASKEFVKVVPHVLVNNEAELVQWMDHYSETDEGIIIRDPREKYTFDKRTRGCMRWKYLKDAEYPVYDIVDGIGKNVGIPTFWCYDPKIGGPDCKKAQFKADSTGTREKRLELFRERDNIIGKELVTVTFQNLTKRGVPRFGKVKCVRNYE